MKNTQLRYYYVSIKDCDEYGFGILSTSIRKAKVTAFQHIKEDGFEDTEWIDIQIKWNKKTIVPKHMVDGVVEFREGLMHGLYDNVMYYDCEVCKREVTCIYSDNKIMCEECAEEPEKKNE